MNIPILDSIREGFRELALQSPNREVGSYFYKGKLHSIENVSPDPHNFEPNLEDTDRILSYLGKGEEVILLHSHVNENSDFSVQDIVMSRANSLPIYLFHLKSGVERYFDPNAPIAPYEGRTWHWAYQNCYTIVQEFYKKEYDIKLKDFYLDHPTEFNDPQFNKFLLNIQTQGFIQLREGDELRKGDLILFSLKINPNHMGLMFDPEANKFLHQLVDRFSRLSSYCSSYRHLTHSIYRHQKLL